MRIVFFGNGPVALDVLHFLRTKGEEVVALVLHDEGKRRLGEELIGESGLAPERVFSAGTLGDLATVDQLRRLGADIGFSALFAVILKPDVLGLFPRGVVNVHPSYLPFNRGRNAQIWSILDGSPVGATLHYMDDGVDTGPMINRVLVEVELTDTGESLRGKLEQACVDVTRAGWPAVVAGTAPMPQALDDGSMHRVREVDEGGEIDLDAQVRAGDLIDLLRSMTSPPQARGAWFKTATGRVWVSVALEADDEGGP